MSFEDQVGYANDALFRKRVRMATITAAIAVQGEAQGSMPGSEYTKRQVLATKVIQTAGIGTPTEDVARMFLWAVIANVAISPASSDGDIQFTVNSVWGDCAGVTGDES